MRISVWSSDVCSADLGNTFEDAGLVCDGAEKQVFVRFRPLVKIDQYIGADGEAQPFGVERGVIAGDDACLFKALCAPEAGRLGHPGPCRRSEARRVGKEWVRTCRSRWAPYHKK